jgi:hypothetical protein
LSRIRQLCKRNFAAPENDECPSRFNFKSDFIVGSSEGLITNANLLDASVCELDSADIAYLEPSETEIEDSNKDELLFISCLLVYFKYCFKFSYASLHATIQLMKCINPVLNIPNSLYVAYSVIRKHIFNVNNHYSVESGTVYLDVKWQLETILKNNLELVLQYNQLLTTSKGSDVLSSCKQHQMHNQVLSSAESFTCFLAICCDGTSIYRNKNVSFWPIQLMILNLPIHLRHKTHNMVLYSICSRKPDWNIVFKNLELLQDSYICLHYN